MFFFQTEYKGFEKKSISLNTKFHVRFMGSDIDLPRLLWCCCCFSSLVPKLNFQKDTTSSFFVKKENKSKFTTYRSNEAK